MMKQVGIVTAAIAGTVLIVVAVLTSSGAIERALLVGETGSLAWGPALFRILLAVHGLMLFTAAIYCRAVPRSPTGPVLHRAETPPDDLRPSNRTVWGCLVTLSILALALRLWRLDTCLWLDEILTLVRFAHPPLRTIIHTFPDQNQHMLYSVLAHGSLVSFGESAWALRLPAVFFGVASVWALYLLGQMIATRVEALLAAALLTVSYHHVWFSQNARGYSGLLFFTLLGTYLFLQGLQDGRWRWWIGYAACASLGLWIHMTMIFVIVTHVMVYGWFLMGSLFGTSGRGGLPLFDSRRWRPLIGLALGATLTLQLYALALPQFFRSALHEVSLPSEWTHPLWVVRDTLASLQIGLGGLAGVAAGGTLFLAGLISFGRSNRKTVALLLLPALIGTFTMFVLQHNLWPRFFFFCFGYGLLIAIRGAMVCGWLPAWLFQAGASRTTWARRFGTVATLMMIAVSAASLGRCYSLPKQDYLSAKTYVETHRRPGESVVAVGLAAFSYGWYYAPEWEVVDTAPELGRLQATSDATWLIYTLRTQLEAYCPEIWSIIKRDFRVVKVFPGTLRSGEVYVCYSEHRPISAE